MTLIYIVNEPCFHDAEIRELVWQTLFHRIIRYAHFPGTIQHKSPNFAPVRLPRDQWTVHICRCNNDSVLRLTDPEQDLSHHQGMYHP